MMRMFTNKFEALYKLQTYNKENALFSKSFLWIYNQNHCYMQQNFKLYKKKITNTPTQYV